MDYKSRQLAFCTHPVEVKHTLRMQMITNGYKMRQNLQHEISSLHRITGHWRLLQRFHETTNKNRQNDDRPQSNCTNQMKRQQPMHH